ncbi:hypothetical protein [Nostoc sp.]|uniref:hypothetical protein n=1 Tax=Nostoc sp. TaxID=1180 RepID=UPI002FF689C5
MEGYRLPYWRHNRNEQQLSGNKSSANKPASVKVIDLLIRNFTDSGLILLWQQH